MKLVQKQVDGRGEIQRRADRRGRRGLLGKRALLLAALRPLLRVALRGPSRARQARGFLGRRLRLVLGRGALCRVPLRRGRLAAERPQWQYLLFRFVLRDAGSNRSAAVARARAGRRVAHVPH